jgi:hypothetical protein
VGEVERRALYLIGGKEGGEAEGLHDYLEHFFYFLPRRGPRSSHHHRMLFRSYAQLVEEGVLPGWDEDVASQKGHYTSQRFVPYSYRVVPLDNLTITYLTHICRQVLDLHSNRGRVRAEPGSVSGGRPALRRIPRRRGPTVGHSSPCGDAGAGNRQRSACDSAVQRLLRNLIPL